MALPSEVVSMIRKSYADLAAHTAVGGERDLRVLAGILAAADSIPSVLIPNRVSSNLTAILGTIRSAIRSWEIDSRRHHISGGEVLELRAILEQCPDDDVTQSKGDQIDPALLDVLVPLKNRRAFDIDSPRLIAHAKSSGESVALIRFDVDHFKRVNDDYGGHDTGDEALKAVAQVAQACVRGKGTAYRLSGDEFALVLPNHTEAEAIALAERLRKAVSKEPVTHRSITITVSVGVSIYPTHGEDLASLNSAADGAAYEAKKLGRDLVRVVGETAHTSEPRTAQRKQPQPDVEHRRSVIEWSRHFRDERITRIRNREGAASALISDKLICINVVPASAISGESTLAVNELDTEATFLPPFGSTGFNTEFNGEGLLRVAPDSSGKNASYLQISRNGIIESVNSQMLVGRGRQDGLPAPAFCRVLGTFLSNAIQFFQAVKIPPPVCIFLTVVGVKDAPLLVEANPGYYTRGFDRDVISLPEIVVESFSADPDPKRLLRPALDVLWQHAGLDSCPYFLSDGTWNLRIL